MPGFLTHYTFAAQADENIKNKNAFYLGAQGGDVFYFSLPYKRGKKCAGAIKFASMLHKKQCAETLAFMYKYANEFGGYNKGLLLSYVYGFIAHYSLDSLVHPYVFSRTGFSEDVKDNAVALIRHHYFESAIDSIISSEFSTFKKPKVIFNLSSKEVEHISRMLYVVAKNQLHYSGIDEDTFSQCYKDMLFVYSFTFATTKAKEKILKLIKKGTLIASMISSKKAVLDYKIDYMNYSNKEWKDPVSGIFSNVSVLELFNQGLLKYKNFIDDIQKETDYEKLTSMFMDFVGRVDYEGVPYGEKKYYMSYNGEKLW